MIITKRHLSRRALLRGAGRVAIALPFLDAMHPALSAERLTAAAPVRRLGIVYYPLGVVQDKWLPAQEGDLVMSKALAPLDRHKKKLLVIAGLSSDVDREKAGFHDRATASWLTGVEPIIHKVQVGASVDQIAAAKLAKETRFGSLEMTMETPNVFATPVYRDANTLLPFEINPRLVFERLFGESGRIDPVAAAQRTAQDRSTLDEVTERIRALQARLGPSDRRKLEQYLESIRDVERGIQIASSKTMPDLPKAERPEGQPFNWVDHVNLTFSLQTLAYQADLTRVVTVLMGREASPHTHDHLGVTMGHHESSHHNYDPVKLNFLHRINLNQSELFAKFLDRLEAVQEPSGSLLDNAIIMFGSTLSNPTVHSQRDLPVMLAGGAGGLKGGRFVRVPGDTAPWLRPDGASAPPAASPTPISNLHLSILDKLGVPTDKLGDSTGRFNRLDV